MESSLVLVIIAAVLGGLVMILGSIYAYIYCVKLKPRKHNAHDHRLPHYHSEPGHSGTADGAKGIKTHPFFIMHYMKKMKETNAQGPSH